MKNIHEKSNKLIAAVADGMPIGTAHQNGRAIKSLKFERIFGHRPTLRAICSDAKGAILDIAEAEDYATLRKYLAANNKIGLKYSDLVYKQCQEMWAEIDGIDTFNEAEKAKSPGMIDQFFAHGLVYSITHNPSFKVQLSQEVRTNPEFYTVYVQTAAIEDPDDCLVTTESFDTLFESIQFIRNEIEKALFQAFKPGAL